MLSPDQSRIELLLAQWKEGQATGRLLAAEDLCKDDPALLLELRTQLAKLNWPCSSDETLPLDMGSIKQLLSVKEAKSSLPSLPNYRFEAVIGRGGMGVVYRAMQMPLNRVVALKMILSGEHASVDERLRFLSEAETVAKLQHPGIVQVYEFGTHGDHPYFAMEYLTGGALDQTLQGTPMAPREAATLVMKLAEAVQAAHALGIIHRDLKPANILLSSNGEPKITDFGLAKTGSSNLTATGKVLGTPSYMSPEQAEGKKEIGPATDIYALGAILYECLVGRPPFRAATPIDTILQVIHNEPVSIRQLQAKTPMDLETICQKCLLKDPSKRYYTAQELADDLKHYLKDEPILARPVGHIEKLKKWVYRRPTVAALLALLIGTMSLGFSTILLLYLNSEEHRNAAVKASLKAMEEKRIADVERNAAQQARDESRIMLARHYDEKAQEFLETHDPSLALFWTAQSLKLSPLGTPIEEHNRILWSNLQTRLPRRISFAHPDPEFRQGQYDFIPDDSRYFAQGLRFVSVSLGKVKMLLRFLDPSTGREIREAISLPARTGDDKNDIELDVKHDRFLLLTRDKDDNIKSVQAYGLDGKPLHPSWKCHIKPSFAISPSPEYLCGIDPNQKIAIYRISDGQKRNIQMEGGANVHSVLKWDDKHEAILVRTEVPEPDQFETGLYSVHTGILLGKKVKHNSTYPSIITKANGEVWLAAWSKFEDKYYPFACEMRSGTMKIIKQGLSGIGPTNWSAICLSKNAHFLVFHDRGELREFDVDTAEATKTWKTERLSEVQLLTFSPTSHRLIVSGIETTELWDWKNKNKICEYPIGTNNFSDNVFFSERGETFILRDQLDLPHLFESLEGTIISPPAYSTGPSTGKMSSDGRFIANTDIWDPVALAAMPASKNLVGPSALSYLSINNSGKVLVGTGNHYGWMWDGETHQFIGKFWHYSANFAQCTRTGDRFVTVSNYYPLTPDSISLGQTTIKLWNPVDKQEIATLVNIPNSVAYSTLFSPDDRWILIGLHQRQDTETQRVRPPDAPSNVKSEDEIDKRIFYLRVFDAKTGKLIKEHQQPDDLELHFSASEVGVFGVGQAQLLQFSLPHLQLLRNESGKIPHDNMELMVNNHLVRSSEKVQIYSWQTSPPKLLCEKPGKPSLLLGHEKKNYLAIAQEGWGLQSQYEVRVINVSNGESVSAVLRHPRSVLRMCFSHHGRWLATVCRFRDKEKWEAELRIWDVETGTLLQVPTRIPSDGIHAIWFSNQDQDLFVMDQNHQLHNCKIQLSQNDLEEAHRLASWHTQMQLDSMGSIVTVKSNPPASNDCDPDARCNWIRKTANRAESVENKKLVRQYLEEFRPRSGVFSDHIWLGYKWLWLEEYDNAYAAFDQAVHVAPQHALSWAERGLIQTFHQLKNKNEKKDASFIVQQLTRGLPDLLKSQKLNSHFHTTYDAQILSTLRIALRSSMPPSLHQLALETCHEMCHGIDDHANVLLLAQYRNGRYAEVLQELERGTESETFSCTHADVAMMLGSPWASAVVSLRAATKERHILRAMTYAKLNRPTDAKKWLRKAQGHLSGLNNDDDENARRLMEEAKTLIQSRSP